MDILLLFDLGKALGDRSKDSFFCSVWLANKKIREIMKKMELPKHTQEFILENGKFPPQQEDPRLKLYSDPIHEKEVVKINRSPAWGVIEKEKYGLSEEDRSFRVESNEYYR